MDVQWTYVVLYLLTLAMAAQCQSCVNLQTIPQQTRVASVSDNILSCTGSTWYRDQMQLDISQNVRYSAISNILHIANINGSDEGFYHCLQGSATGKCLVVLGKAVFQNCTLRDQSTENCNDDISLTITAGDNIVLPTRLKFINGGSFGRVQTVRNVKIFKDNVPDRQYLCTNNDEEGEDGCGNSNQWTVSRYSDNEFDFDLTRIASEDDSGEYTIRYEVEDGQEAIQNFLWEINVVVQQGNTTESTSTAETIADPTTTEAPPTTTLTSTNTDDSIDESTTVDEVTTATGDQKTTTTIGLNVNDGLKAPAGTNVGVVAGIVCGIILVFLVLLTVILIVVVCKFCRERTLHCIFTRTKSYSLDTCNACPTINSNLKTNKGARVRCNKAQRVTCTGSIIVCSEPISLAQLESNACRNSSPTNV